MDWYILIFSQFSVHINDRNVQKALKVDIKTHGFDIQEETSNISLIYRV